MKRRVIELMVLSAFFLQSPIANAMETNQTSHPLSGPTDPLPPKPFPPPPPPSPRPPEPEQPNQILPRT